jgi:hypothetical protein
MTATALIDAALTAALMLAQDVTFGGPVAGTNTSPFTDYHFVAANRYQQLYVGSRFGRPVLIDAIRFADTSAKALGCRGSITPGDYLVRLAVTERAENALVEDFEANVGGEMATFFCGEIGHGTLRIVGQPYLFDPARGNLLLDVTVRSQTPLGLLGLDFSRCASDGTSRVFNTFPLPSTPSGVRVDEYGLNTTFETRALTSPASGLSPSIRAVL